MVVNKGRFHHNGRSCEEPTYGLLGGINVGVHIGGSAQHGIAAYRHGDTEIELQVFGLDAAQVKTDTVAIPKLFLSEIINGDFLVLCLHLGSIDVEAGKTANGQGRLLH